MNENLLNGKNFKMFGSKQMESIAKKLKLLFLILTAFLQIIVFIQLKMERKLSKTPSMTVWVFLKQTEGKILN